LRESGSTELLSNHATKKRENTTIWQIQANTETEYDSEAAEMQAFDKLMDLVYTRGFMQVIYDVSILAEIESEDEEICDDCKRFPARLHLELNQLLDRMDDFSS
jgi:hypothetical protein